MKTYDVGGQNVGLVNVDLEKEYELERVINEYEPQEDDNF